MTGGKILWAKDENGEIGKQPKDDPGTFWISAETYTAMQAELASRMTKGRKA